MHAKQHLALVLVYNLGKATRFSRRYRLLVAAMDTRTIGATSNRSTSTTGTAVLQYSECAHSITRDVFWQMRLSGVFQIWPSSW